MYMDDAADLLEMPANLVTKILKNVSNEQKKINQSIIKVWWKFCSSSNDTGSITPLKERHDYSSGCSIFQKECR